MRLRWRGPFKGMRGGRRALLGVKVKVEDVLAVELGLLAGFGGGGGKGAYTLLMWVGIDHQAEPAGQLFGLLTALDEVLWVTVLGQR